jgi:hypothetical protein
MPRATGTLEEIIAAAVSQAIAKVGCYPAPSRGARVGGTPEELGYER